VILANGALTVTGTTYTGIVPVQAHSSGTQKGANADYRWNVVVNGAVEFGQPLTPYAALGDSYSSGQLPPLLPGGEACSRSSLSYAVDYDPIADVLACSGATINNIRDDQVPLVPTRARLVTITAGGNDTSIFLQLINCVTGSATFTDCASQYKIADFSDLEPRLVALYKAVHEQAPKAQIYVMGYPDAFPATPQASCPGLGAGGYLKVYGTDAPYFYALVQELDRVVKRAAAASGTAHYVTPFSGHDVCSTDSYFMPLDTPSALEKLHPNAAGHMALAQLLQDAAGPPPD
jgi:lysophospholipase L1-like esterase